MVAQHGRSTSGFVARAYARFLFWDGRATNLEEQALKPIEHPAEMANTVATAIDRLKQDAGYRSLFAAAYSDGVTATNLARALASFERTLLTGDSKVDRFRRGSVSALNEEELHGLWLFESRARCWRCHSGENFSDESFHNTGVSWGREPADLGRFAVTANEGDRGRFKTPTLRAAAYSAPYMHDGSIATLETVVEFYNRGGNSNPNLDAVMAPLGLSPQEARALVAFLRALSHSGEPAAPFK